MGITSTKITPVDELLNLPLQIPDYQRPYRWQSFHVNQLLDDLLFHQGRQRYRLGTVVLHARKDQAGTLRYDIVDGQQRLLTMLLLCHQLAPERAQASPLLQSKFTSSISIAGLRQNAALVRQRLSALSDGDRTALRHFVLERCELICVTLDSLNEAFQFFDAQNARGVPLRPEDLLKAYHLREMETDDDAERTACVAAWEQSVKPADGSPRLDFMMGAILFRLRRWATGRSAQKFTRKDIAVFKGVSLHAHDYPHVRPMRRLDRISRSAEADAGSTYPYLADQVMLNGRHFFGYVRHYTEAYSALFGGSKPQLDAIIATLRRYPGRGRRGDRYVWELFAATVLYYHAKFGDQDLEKVARLCFAWAYRFRLLQSRVEVATIDRAGRDPEGMIAAIRHAIHPHEVSAMVIAPIGRNDVAARKVGEVMELFDEFGYLQ